ncbi:MAG: ATPase domain-containing protein [Cyanobacteria bacterium P01_A01_bin.17]
MPEIKLLPTCVPNLDAVLGGGIPIYSLNIVAGSPGSGKTILVQQILFSHIQKHPDAKALYLSTLSEPSMKVVRYMQYFQFFDAKAFGERVIYHDLGTFLVENPLTQVADQIMELVNEHQAEILVIDSFKAINDLATHAGDFRRFCFDLSIRLASSRCTTFLVNESDSGAITQSTEFAIADGIFYLSISEKSGTPSRFLQVYKLRGRDSFMERFPFLISDEGIKVLSPALTLRRRETNLEIEEDTLMTGIEGLDQLLKGGIPLGRSLILSGVSGTGKTTFALQFLVEGAKRQEKGLLLSFEETRDRLYRSAAGFGWDLASLEEQGVLRVIFVPQTDIRIEEQLELLIQEVEEFNPRRLVVDSLSVFLYRVQDPAIQREKTFQLATLMQRVGGVGILISDIPANDINRLSRFGVEETIADGTIVLSTKVFEKRRQRYLEVFKMRAADYVAGHHRMKITSTGIQVFFLQKDRIATSDPNLLDLKLVFQPLQNLFQGALPLNSTWLLRGESGLGKSTLACQFVMEGLRNQASVLYVGTDVSTPQSLKALEMLGSSPRSYLESGQLVMLDVFGTEGNALTLDDTEVFLFTLAKQLDKMPKPCHVVMDSLTPLAIAHTHTKFVNFIARKNRLLRQPAVLLFDVFLIGILEAGLRSSLLNAYDVSVEMYRPNWGEMSQHQDFGYPSLRITKARGVRVDHRPYPYTLSATEGVKMQANYYQDGFQ